MPAWRVTIGVKIFAIAAGLLALMAVVALLTLTLARDVGTQLDRVINNYLPGYGALATANVRSVEQGLYLRRLVIAHLETPPDTEAIDADRRILAEKGRLTDLALAAARREIAARLANPGPFTDVVALARLDTRIELLAVERQRYDRQVATALAALERKDARDDTLRDEFNGRIDGARAEMLRLAAQATAASRLRADQVIRVSVLLMTLAGALGLLAAGVITFTLVRPVRRLLAGTQAVEAGALDTVVPVTSKDEIGVLTTAFNHMIVQLRVKERNVGGEDTGNMYGSLDIVRPRAGPNTSLSGAHSCGDPYRRLGGPHQVAVSRSTQGVSARNHAKAGSARSLLRRDHRAACTRATATQMPADGDGRARAAPLHLCRL